MLRAAAPKMGSGAHSAAKLERCCCLRIVTALQSQEKPREQLAEAQSCGGDNPKHWERFVRNKMLQSREEQEPTLTHQPIFPPALRCDKDQPSFQGLR